MQDLLTNVVLIVQILVGAGDDRPRADPARQGRRHGRLLRQRRVGQPVRRHRQRQLPVAFDGGVRRACSSSARWRWRSLSASAHRCAQRAATACSTGPHRSAAPPAVPRAADSRCRARRAAARLPASPAIPAPAALPPARRSSQPGPVQLIAAVPACASPQALDKPDGRTCNDRIPGCSEASCPHAMPGNRA